MSFSGCDDRANAAHSHKSRRPKGFLVNSIPRNFPTGTKPGTLPGRLCRWLGVINIYGNKLCSHRPILVLAYSG